MRKVTRKCFVGGLLSSSILLLGTVGGPAAEQAQRESWIGDIRAPQYFAVSVQDVNRAVAWYGAVFGLELLGGSAAEDGSWRIENLGNASLLIEIMRDERAATAERARGFRKVGFQVADVEAVADRVAMATGERPRVVEDERLGLRIIQLRDPEGNVLQLFSRLPPAGEAGHR